MWFILVSMKRFLRAVIPLLLLMLSSDGTIGSGILSNIVPSTGTTPQSRSSMSVSAARPRKMGFGIYEDQSPLADQPADADENYFPCESLSIATSGAVCDDYELNFPEVNLKAVLDGDSYLPHKSTPP